MTDDSPAIMHACGRVCRCHLLALEWSESDGARCQATGRTQRIFVVVDRHRRPISIEAIEIAACPIVLLRTPEDLRETVDQLEAYIVERTEAAQTTNIKARYERRVAEELRDAVRWWRERECAARFAGG